REVAGVEGEQPGGVGGRGLDVAPLVADDERIAVEDLDEPVVHRRPRFGGPGRRRRKRTSSRGSPSTMTVPRRTAAVGLVRPEASARKTGSSARTVTSAGAPWRGHR